MQLISLTLQMFVPRAFFFKRCPPTYRWKTSLLLLTIGNNFSLYCRVPLHNKQYFLVDWSLLQHCGSTTSQCGHDKGGQDIQSQVYLRHVFQKHYLWNDAHQVRLSRK